MGIVYLAEDTMLNRKVALKILPVDITSDTTFTGRFQREAAAIAAISHPNVVRVHAFDLIDGIPAIDMEYVEGGSLAQKIRRDPVTVHDVVRFVHGVASALAYCHSKDLIHRDVKPSNILIDLDRNARLADFGIAKVLGGAPGVSQTETLTSIFHGTPQYAAPEAWAGGEPCASWDIYSLGIVAYEALTGEAPYRSRTPLELAREMAHTPIPPVKTIHAEISDRLSAVVERMTAPDPGDRIADSDELVKLLSETPEFLEDIHTETITRPILKGPALPGSTAGHGIRRRGAGIAFAVATVSCIVLALFLAWSFRNGSGPGAPLPQRVGQSAAVPRQDGSTGSLSVPELLQLSKAIPPDRMCVLRVHNFGPESRDDELWLVSFSEKGEPAAVVTQGTAHLSHVDLLQDSADEPYRVSGHWAGFLDYEATVLSRGAVEGRIIWEPDSQFLNGTLVYHSIPDGATLEVSVNGVPHESFTTDSRFVYELEESPYLLSLLNAELLPRGDPWAEAVDGLLPSFTGGRVRVSTYLGPQNTVVVDGVFDEDGWKAVRALRQEPNRVLTGGSAERRGTMQFSKSESSLLIAATCDVTPGIDDLVLDVRMLRSYAIPMTASPYLRITYALATGETRADYVPAEGLEHPVTVSFANSTDAGFVQIEGEIPFATFDPFIGAPAPGDRWRFNAVLRAKTFSDERAVVCRWGFPDESALAHGAILEFDK